MRQLSHARRGATLVELLIGMLVGLIVLGIALQLTLLARASYQRVADDALIESRGTQALELLTTALQHAGWVTDTPAVSPERRWPDAKAALSIQGADSCAPREAEALECNSSDIQGSDALLVRFAGRSMQTKPDRTDQSIVDCSGYGVAERVQNGSEEQRAGYGTAATTLSARSLTAEQWRQVQAVHIVLVVRGDYNSPSSANKTTSTLALFPNLQRVEGANAQDLQFTPTQPHRHRAVFTATVHLRNPLACDVDVC